MLRVFVKLKNGDDLYFKSKDIATALGYVRVSEDYKKFLRPRDFTAPLHPALHIKIKKI